MYTTELAVVLRAENYRENDRMLTLFTRESGRVEALARGCRKIGGSLSAVSEPFSCAEVQLYRNKNRITVTQCAPKESFYEIREDFEAFACGSFLLSVCEKCIVPESPERKLFALLVNCLFALKKKADPVDTALFFMLRLLSHLGQDIELSHCIHCGNAETTAIDFEAGGASCKNCSGVPFGSDFIKLLRYMKASGVKSIIDTVFGADKASAFQFIGHALDISQIGRPKSYDFFMKLLSH
ncbi:MAG: DNA repair protein RecO [Christensenellaceae bacterium]|nr:DNA repair protein RecO [Christensenellaceae bacterium]MBR3842061.1 DNA repair protein RecO [Christensenellaceae bacterium]